MAVRLCFFGGVLRRFFGLVLLLVLSASCSRLEPEYIACPEVRAVAGAEHVVFEAVGTGHPISVRFDGVMPRCLEGVSGYDIAFNFALVLRRGESDSSEAEQVAIDITLAYLDASEQVVGRRVERVEGRIGAGSSSVRSVYQISERVPKGVRILVGLGRKSE